MWLLLVIGGSVGLPRLRVSNSLESWAPGTASSPGLATYMVIGFEASAADASRLEGTLRGLASVSWCIGPASQVMLRAAGISPERLVLSDDHRYAGIYCFARPGVPAERLYRDVLGVLRSQEPGVNGPFALGGSAAYVVTLDEVTQRGMTFIVTGITIAGGAMLWWLTGRLRAAVSGLAAIIGSMVLLLGVLGWLGINADMSLLLVPPLMISLGYSYAAHAAMRVDAAPALTICGVTSVLGIAAFGTADLASIRAFSIAGSAGIVLTWLGVVALVARPSSPRPDGPADRGVRAALLRAIRRAPRAIVAGAVIMASLGVWLAPSLTVDAQPLNYFSSAERIVHDTRVLEERLTGTLPFEVVAPRGVSLSEALRREAVVRKVVEIPASISGRERAAWCLADSGTLDSLRATFDRWRAGGSSGVLSVRGVAPQLLEVRRQMRHVAAWSIPCMLLVAGAAAGLLGRSLRAGLAGVLVNLAPVGALIALGVAFSWTCQMPTLMVGAIGIGAGIDDAVHVLWLRRRRTLAGSLRTCLRACVGSSAIAAACMGAFALSPFRPTAQFGVLMALVLVLAAVADMVVLPAILRVRWGAGGEPAGARP